MPKVDPSADTQEAMEEALKLPTDELRGAEHTVLERVNADRRLLNVIRKELRARRNRPEESESKK